MPSLSPLVAGSVAILVARFVFNTAVLIPIWIFAYRRRNEFPLNRRTQDFMLANTALPLVYNWITFFFNLISSVSGFDIIPCMFYEIFLWMLLLLYGNNWILTGWKIYFLQKATEARSLGQEDSWFLRNLRFNSAYFIKHVELLVALVLLYLLVPLTLSLGGETWLQSLTLKETCYNGDLIIVPYLIMIVFYIVCVITMVILLYKFRKVRDGLNFRRDLRNVMIISALANGLWILTRIIPVADVLFTGKKKCVQLSLSLSRI